jgi:N-acetylglucosaminyldiphosphoundecaprenol N-acetyl-beta-D-mannosaminyltransferase
VSGSERAERNGDEPVRDVSSAPVSVDGLPSVEIFGVTVHGPTLDQAAAIIESWIAQPDGRCRQAIVTGFHGLWVAHEDPAYRRVLNQADLFCPDGIAPIWLSRLHGAPLPQRTPGRDLMAAVLRLAQERGYSSYFYGDSDATLAALRARLAEKFPGARVAGTLSPPFRALSDDEETAHVAAINHAGADVLWVGLGLPKQDEWIARNLRRLNARAAIGVGAAFAFLAGAVPHAPKWLGDAGFEWVWRLAAEPKKMWKRDLTDGPRFVAAAFADAMRARRARLPSSTTSK